MENNYSKRHIKNILKQDLTIPDIVTKKVHDAFIQIQSGYEPTQLDESIATYKRQKRIKTQLSIAATIILIFASMSVAAYSIANWHSIIVDEFKTDERLQEEMNQIGLSDKPDANTVIINDVQVEAVQSIIDDKYMYLLFKVTTLDDITFPFHEVETEDSSSSASPIYEDSPSFHDFSLFVDKEPFYAFTGGSKVMPGENEHTFYYQISLMYSEDGNMDIRGKNLRVDLKTLLLHNPTMQQHELLNQRFHSPQATNAQDESLDDLIKEGIWQLNWTISTANVKQIHAMNQPIPELDTIVRNITITPLSITVEYDWPFYEKTGLAEYQYFGEPLLPTEFRMKDGSTVSSKFSLFGSSGYTDKAMTAYRIVGALEKIPEIDNIQSVIFNNGEIEIPISQ